MSVQIFDMLTREAALGASRRSSLFGLGGAALTAVLMSLSPAGAPGTEAKGSNKGKKAKKKFKKKCAAQPEQCQAALQTSCLQFEDNAAECVGLFVPCCAQFTNCDVSAGITCMITVLASQ